MKCPKDHEVGTKWENRVCTELTCAEVAPVGLTSKRETKEKAIAEMPAQPKGRRLREDEVPEELKARHALFLERARTAGMPASLAGDAAVAWSEAKLVEMLPEAIAALQWDLRYGSAKERGDAVQSVLKANGVAQKEAAVHSAPTIVLQLGDSITDMPFLKRAAESKKAPK